MASILTQLFPDSAAEASFYELAKKNLSTWCKNSNLWQTIAQVHHADETDHEELLTIALSEVWAQLVAEKNQAALDDLVMHLHSRTQSEGLSQEVVMREVLHFGFRHFSSAVLDANRQQDEAKKSYRQISGFLNKSEQIVTKTYVNLRRKNVAFAPKGTDEESPVAALVPNLDFSDLQPPQNIAIKNLFSQKVIVPQAIDFWKDYIATRCQGNAHFIPLYTFFQWLCQRHQLGEPRILSIYKDEDDETPALSNVIASPKDDTPENLYFEKLILEDAKHFAEYLPKQLVALCALYYADEDANQEEVAHILGFKHASGLDRYKKDFISRLKKAMLRCFECEEERESRDMAQYFLETVYDECKRIYAESTNERAGGVRDDQ